MPIMHKYDLFEHDIDKLCRDIQDALLNEIDRAMIELQDDMQAIDDLSMRKLILSLRNYITLAYDEKGFKFVFSDRKLL